jgi:hypothetical protein
MQGSASSIAASLALRLDAKANSDMANTPLIKVRSTIIKISIPVLCQGQNANEIALRRAAQKSQKNVHNDALSLNLEANVFLLGW